LRSREDIAILRFNHAVRVETSTMRTLTNGAIASLALVVLAACTTISVDSTRDETRHRPPKPRDHDIEVFHDTIPDRPHKVIGSVLARVKHSPEGDTLWPDHSVLERLKVEARRLGGDALIGLAADRQADGGTYLSPPATVLTGSSTIWSASVIVWLDR
jgi:hypothetical protein